VSNIVIIYTNLAAKDVAYDGATVEVYGLDATPGFVEQGNLPRRVLLYGRDTDGNFGFLTIGTLARPTWTIYDLLLVRKQALGRGVVDVSTPVMMYCGAYIDMLRTFREPGGTGSQTTLDAATVEPGIFEYPLSSGETYYGVLATLTVREVLSAST
jgi:hypothetical protein